MTIHEPGGPQTPEGNYELQQQYLLDKQRTISGELFAAGVASRIILSTQSEGAAEDLEGFAQLDKLFVPALHDISEEPRHDEQELSMVAVTTADDETQKYSYFRVGRVDNAGIVFPYENVASEDADLVWQHASALLADKEAGIIPDLAPDLLSIDNPNTLLMYIPPSP